MVGSTPNDNPARSLTLNHIRDLKNGGGVSELEQGQQKLYSFYAPSLKAGDYTIDVKQEINTVPDEQPVNKDNTKTLGSTQNFTVVAPRFALPAGSIHSMYPAPGRPEPAKTLPHVVLNDPHLPWERDALGDSGDDEKERDENGYYVKQNQVPWLAVLVFTQEELRLDEKHLKRDSGIFPKTVAIPPPPDPKAPPPDPNAPPPNIPQNKTLAINMTITDLLEVKNTTTPISILFPSDVEKALTTDVIFLQNKLFNSLVTTYDGDGKPVDGQKFADVSRYKFLAHARQVSTKGMVIDNADHEAFFSVVISHRVGPLDLTQPTPVVVHLVSIEGVGKMTLPITTEFVALSSLYSWTYTCLPAHSMDILYSFQHLGDTLDMLRPSWDIIKNVEPSEKKPDEKEPDEKKPPKPTTRIGQRMYDGYSLVRYITQTGEETVAFTRGPFTPATVEYPLRPDWGISTFGTDLQIFDTELGVMDITYSSAWQLGKALALADHPFAAALSRVRTYILDEATSRSKVAALQTRWPGIYKTRAEALRSLLKATESLHLLLMKEPTANRVSRASPAPTATDDYSHGSELIKYTFDLHSHDAAIELSRATNGEIFHEHNEPCSTDWMMVLGWILDRMYLDNIPAHYLISDPTHLPPESLRFFHIDRNWIDAMLDGALSIANHMQCYDSKIRTVIKKMVNAYFKAPLDTEPDSETSNDANSTTSDKPKLLPQIPTYGFLLRSDICSQFPQLVVDAEMPNHLLGAPILYHKNLDKGVMLCLFDRVPSAEFKSLTFTQPPHQQSFSAGDTLDHSTFKMIYKNPLLNEHADERTYVWDNPDIAKPAELDNDQVKVKGPPVFLWGDKGSIRTLLFPPFAQTVFEFNKKQTGKTPTSPETYPGAAMIGVQLGSAIYKLKIQLKEGDSMLVLPTIDWDLKGLDPLDLGPEPVVHAADEQPRLSFPSPECCCTWTQSPLAELVYLTPKTYSRWASVPQFTYKVYSVQSTSQKVLMTTFEQDLVFSIVLERIGGYQMSLEKVVLDIPIGPASWTDPTLMETYQGSVKMLSNLRFNVLAQPGKRKLSITLLPRTQTGNVVAAQINEMSFLMSGVTIHVYPGISIPVKISAKETYLARPEKESKTFEASLVHPT